MHILCIFHYCPPYRIPLFERLAEIYSIEYVFLLDGSKRLERWNEFGKFYFNELHGSKLALIHRLLLGNYDIVISEFIYKNNLHFLLVFVLCKLLRKPIIFFVEEWHPFRTFGRKLISPLIKLILKTSDAYIVCGSKAKKYLISLGASQDTIFIAPDASRTEPESEEFTEKLRDKLDIDDKKVILFIGRLFYAKGVQYLIKAFSRLKKERDDMVLLVGGDGPFRRELLNLCKEINARDVVFLGWIRKNKASYFSLSNVFVLPSMFTNEGGGEAWGLVLNEAMTCGKPVVATDAVGGSPDLIHNGVNGFIVKNADVDSLYEAIKKIISNPRLQRKMGLESGRIIKNSFTYEDTVKGFKKAIKSIKIH